MHPETWQASTSVKPGSWWPEWQDWLDARSSGRVPPPAIGAAAHYPVLADVLGVYVLQE